MDFETLYSDVLSAESLRQILDDFPLALKLLIGDITLTANYGFGTKIHHDLQYLPMRVNTDWLDQFVADSISQGIVVPGRCDFSIVVQDDRLTILFCHEGDIHLSGTDAALLDAIVKLEPFKRIRFRTRAEFEDNHTPG